MSDGVAIRVRSLSKVFGDDPEAALQLLRDGITKTELLQSHGHVLGLRDIDIDIERHSVQVLMGLSGSGKSTLVRHINRLIEPTEGEIHVDGGDVLGLDANALREFRRRDVSMVFQKFALLPHRTVIQNVGYGLTVQGVARRDWHDRATRWIDRVGLSGYEESYPHHLSGGMQQRVGLARALATDADILLMDEAFSALDPLIRADMRTLLLDLQQELRKTILFVTHDLEEAIEIGDRIAILRDGEIVQNAGSQEIILRPADDYIAEFTRGINRGRSVVVGSVMEPPRPGLEPPPACPVDTTLEDALPMVVTAPGEEICCVDSEGRTVGALSAVTLLLAMAQTPSRTGPGRPPHGAADGRAPPPAG